MLKNSSSNITYCSSSSISSYKKERAGSTNSCVDLAQLLLVVIGETAEIEANAFDVVVVLMTVMYLLNIGMNVW